MCVEIYFVVIIHTKKSTKKIILKTVNVYRLEHVSLEEVLRMIDEWDRYFFIIKDVVTIINIQTDSSLIMIVSNWITFDSTHDNRI